MYHTSYLIHYNKNHSKANGQFTSGDGDGDGIANDHANQRKSQSESGSRTLPTRAQARRSRNTGIAMLGATAGLMSLSKVISSVSDDTALSGAAMIASVAAVPLAAVGTVKTVKGAVNMGKASRRGDLS